MFDTYTLLQMLKEHGVTITLRKRVEGAYDVHTGTVGTTNTDHSVKGYFFSQKYSDGTSDQLKSVKGLVLEGSSPSVDATDQIVYGVTYAVLRARKITSGTTTLCYILEVVD